jgi:polysaccharide biosynthesis/export protein
MSVNTNGASVFAIRTLLVVAVIFCSAFNVVSQTRQQPDLKRPAATPPPPDPAVNPTIVVSTDEDYRIGPRDVIELRVEDAAELSHTYSVNADGTFLMPFLKRVNAQGKTPEELARVIADGLRDTYLKDPQVLVVVKQPYSRTFFIQGAVHRPGVYQMEGKPSLLKLITVAGGLAENHGSTAFIIHEVKAKKNEAPHEASSQEPSVASKTDSSAADDGAEYTIKPVKISGLFMGNFDQNMYVEPGDIVNIPVADVFFVAGEVNAPGLFPLSDGTTLRQAIALSQGTTFNAAPSAGVIFRQDQATGQRQEIKVDIAAVMKGKAEDVQILANDIVIVPNSRAKTIGNAILKAFGMGAAQRGPYRY